MNKIFNTVREYYVMYVKEGEKATRKAWEKAEKSTDDFETTTVALCLNALFARGDMTFIEAMFAEKDVTKYFNSKYRCSFLPEDYWSLKGKQYKKWSKVDRAERELASWWAFHNLPFLQNILDKFTADMLKSCEYLCDAQVIRDTFLEEVRDTLGWEGSPSFVGTVVEYMRETLTNDLDLEDYGYDPEGYEAEVWKEFCWDSYGLSDILENVYADFIYEVAEEILNDCV